MKEIFGLILLTFVLFMYLHMKNIHGVDTVDGYIQTIKTTFISETQANVCKGRPRDE